MRFPKTLSLTAVVTARLMAQAPPTSAAPLPPSLLGFTLSGSTTIGSQYIFRGLTQTDGKPTIQGELDLVHPSGFYVSTSLSNISWFTDQNLNTASAPLPVGAVSSASVEVDLSGGYKWGFAKDWTLDLGIYRYFYPGTYDNLMVYRNPDTTETYLGLSYSWASLKYSRVISAADFGVASAEGTSYVDLNLSIPLGDGGWTVLAHGGKTSFASKNGTANSPFNYTDVKLGVSKDFKGYTLTLAGTNADTKGLAADKQTPLYDNAMGRNIGKGRLTFSLAKGF